MYKNRDLKIKLLLDDINEIVNSALWYFTDPHFILDRKELIYSLLSVDERINDIIEFSELGDFIYRPVRSYSSGMHSKLAFSITAILETDIMLIDEVLSVGDIHFKEKSYNKMKELISNDDRTVVIVSHNSNTIKELCNKVIWLHEGLIKDQGDPNIIMDKYEAFMRNEG